MKRKRILILSIAFLVSVGMYSFWYAYKTSEALRKISASSPLGNSSLQSNASASPGSVNQAAGAATRDVIATEREREKQIWNIGLATPITFYGKVVDEKNNPISDATALISFVDTLGTGNDHTKVTKETDSEGMFTVDGHGLSVVVMVSKKGYYKLKSSDGTFGYAKGLRVNPHADASNPAIFTLRKKGKIESLIATSLGGRLNKNGMPLNVDLQNAKKVSDGQGDLKIECWTNDSGVSVNSNKSFDWRCRISVNAGGLIERKGEFDFEAPEAGYQPFVEINMPKSLGRDWRNSLTKEYFIKLANSTYARVQFVMNAGGEQTFYLSGYLNPKAGSKNLEFGPN